jgi:hypothetical protein
MTGTYFILIIAEIRRLKYEFISIVWY